MKKIIYAILGIVACSSISIAGVKYSDPKTVTPREPAPESKPKKELKNWYIGAGIMGGIHHDGRVLFTERFDPGIPDDDAVINLRSGNYLGAEAKLGYRFYFTDAWFFATELNPYYLTGTLKGKGYWTSPSLGMGADIEYKDRVDKINVMLNLLIGYDHKWFRLYAGPGVGVAFVDTATKPEITMTDNMGNSITTTVDDLDPKSAASLAVQGVAGVEFKLNDSWSIYAEYKYLDVTNAKQGQGNVTWRNRELRSSLGSIGFKYSF
ncbi:MAG: autotransporter outer membrane beta-barrel domain-containing protein [Methylacidiphilales bacterium]|nr:autotransporter outer membrane beta-barrel domain-containing protein [Candidatus Methylacidiphilales bacterium]MDW8350001.1 outer membrane beta-barrel protein [Verrucomicrobiae bacterium]